MKLVDILARELMVWPKGCDELLQTSSGRVIGVSNRDTEKSEKIGAFTLNDEGIDPHVTRAEWQAAVDALNAPAVWGVEGLPPVGTVCTLSGPTERLHPIHPEWAGREVKIYAHFTSDNGHELAAYVGTDHMIGGVGVADLFVPIRTPEQVAAEERERGIQEICATLGWLNIRSDGSAQEAAILYDAGYRKEPKPCGS